MRGKPCQSGCEKLGHHLTINLTAGQIVHHLERMQNPKLLSEKGKAHTLHWVLHLLRLPPERCAPNTSVLKTNWPMPLTFGAVVNWGKALKGPACSLTCPRVQRGVGSCDYGGRKVLRPLDPGELMVEFWSESKGLRNSRTDGVSSSPSPGSRAGEDQCLSWKAGRESEFSLT